MRFAHFVCIHISQLFITEVVKPHDLVSRVYLDIQEPEQEASFSSDDSLKRRQSHYLAE